MHAKTNNLLFVGGSRLIIAWGMDKRHVSSALVHKG